MGLVALAIVFSTVLYLVDKNGKWSALWRFAKPGLLMLFAVAVSFTTDGPNPSPLIMLIAALAGLVLYALLCIGIKLFAAILIAARGKRQMNA